jgi:hypothetical protein
MTDKSDATFLLALLILTVFGLVASSVAHSEDAAPGRFICSDQNDDCGTRIIRLPDGAAGQVLKFEICKEGDCDREHMEHWSTHYLVPPPGEVCRNSDVSEALNWIEQHRRGWLLAGWGCVSSRKVSV